MAKNDILIRSKKKQAAALLVKGELQAAKSLYVQLCKKTRMDAEVWTNLSIINSNLGLAEEALECSTKAIKINARSPDINFIHACSLQGQGLLDEAINYYKAVIESKPDHADAYYHLGNIYRLMGVLELAEKNYLMAIQYRPDYLEALSNLAALFVNIGKKNEAQDLLRKADLIRPGCEQVLCNYGNLHLSYGNENEAINYARKVIKINPEFSDAHYLLGKAYRLKGMFDDSLECYKQALKIEPGDEEVVAAISEIHELRGNHETAFELVRPLIEKGNALPSVLTAFAALSTHYDLQEKAIGLLEESLTRASSNLSAFSDVHRSLGMLYDKSGSYDKAFVQYEKFNECLSVLSVKENQHIKTIDAMVNNSADVDFWKRLPRSNNASRKPVFVVGMPRSGTTLTEQILSSHAEIYGAGELTEIGTIAWSSPGKSGVDTKYPQCLEKLTVNMLDDMAESYLASLDKFDGSVLRVVDKMPSNFLHIGLITLLFPNCRIIHVNRNPVDTCLSIYFNKFDSTQEHTTNLVSLGKYYNQYRRLMANWRSVLDTPVLEINYENLINEQERVSREMIEFCGLEWDENCLLFHENTRDVNTPSYHQVRQPVYATSSGRWRNYERHLEPLIQVLESDAT